MEVYEITGWIILITIPLSILLGICSLVGVKGMVFKRVLENIQFGGKYKERIVGSILYFLMIPLFISVTMGIVGYAFTPEEVLAERARIRAEARAKEEAEKEAEKARKAEEEALQKAEEEKARRHTPHTGTPEYDVSNIHVGNVHIPEGLAVEFSESEARDILKKALDKMKKEMSFKYVMYDGLPGDQIMLGDNGRYYYQFEVGGILKRSVTFNVDVLTGDIFENPGYSHKIVPFDEWAGRVGVQIEGERKAVAAEKAAKERKEKELEQRMCGLQVYDIRWINPVTERIGAIGTLQATGAGINLSNGVVYDIAGVVKNTGKKRFKGGTMVINLYAGPHKAGDMYVSISTPLNPGETFYFRQSTGSIEADRCEVDHITESFF